MSRRYFADISSNNRAVDLRAYAKSGAVLIAVKATQGIDYTNPLYSEWAARAHLYGLAVAHYHYCDPTSSASSARSEAMHFWSVVKHHWRAGDYLVLDLESGLDLGARTVCAYLKVLDAALHTISGHAAVGYTYESFIESCGAGLQVRSKRWWIASYGPAPRLLGAGRRRWAWQFTDGAAGPPPHSMPGLGTCDVSRLNWRSTRRLLRVKRARARQHR